MNNLEQRRKGHYKGKYAKEWQLVTGFILAVAVVMAMNGIGG